MRFYITLLSILIFSQVILGQDNQSVLFSHLTTNEGLSQSSVNCILKDKYGFLWFGTNDGLNKYDGYTFKAFRNNPGSTKTIPNNRIMCLLEDKSGELWIGTLGWGIAKYNRGDDSFTSYGGGAILSIYESSDSALWIGTFFGLKVFDRKTKKIISASSENKQLSEIENLATSCVYEDSRRNLWIINSSGIFFLCKKTGRLRNIENLSISTDNPLSKILEDREGHIWAGTRNGLYAFCYRNDTLVGQRDDLIIPDQLNKSIISMCINKDQSIWVGKEDGLAFFNPAKGTCTSFGKNPQDDQSLSHDLIRSLYLDDQEILWIGTLDGGVNKYDKNQLAFKRCRIFSAENPKLISNTVTSFEEDPSGNIWIGTDRGGAFLWEISRDQFIPFYPGSKKNYFPSYSVLTLKMSRDKQLLWLGTNDQGLVEINIKTKAKRIFNKKNGKLYSNYVTSIIEDRNGKLWVATNGGGISILNKVTGKAEKDNILPNAAITVLFQDTDGSIWMGGYYGISIYNPYKKTFVNLHPGNSNMINGVINSIFKDSEDNIWVGTAGGGLELYDRKSKNFISFSEDQGLANNIVNSIVEDARGYLWIATCKGISRFDRRKHTFKNYTREDGLQSNEFIKGAGYVTAAGKILMGSVDGFNVFSSEDDKINTNIPSVAITDFQLFHKSLPTGVYNHRENDIPQITLSHDQNVFSIEFVALSYTVSEKNQYAYMLEGFDENWNYTGYHRKATYTNLDPGEYTFRVIASNNDGIWNKKGTSLKIIITPPFWKTRMAYLLYLLFVIAILYYIYREIKAREKLKNEIVFQKLTAEKMEELNQMKLNFFTNISHELRTPLSLIIDPLRKIIKGEASTSQINDLSNMAFRNALRLSGLVNQLLDFRRFSGRHKLEPKHVNLVETIMEIYQSFEEKSRERKIEFDLSFNTTFKDAWIDTDKLEKILTNLISNAFKFTPNGGKIHMLVSTSTEKDGTGYLEIHVKDTGPGIPEAYKQKIFDLFFQIEGAQRYEQESSGIGLALVRELVLLHGGKISEMGKPGEGAVFVVRLPLKEYTFSPNETEVTEEETKEEESIIISSETDVNSNVNENLPESPLILLVEDNTELREYIASEALAKYHVEQASNGAEGFEKATGLIPDLIISDIMMPESNGLELCGRLKADERTSHIPVILLTAKQTDDNKIEGYKKGADAYVSKPFNSDLLFTQVENLLESRKRLRDLFSKTGNEKLTELSITEIDKEFLEKMKHIILDNLSNPQFDVENFAEMLKMNRRQLVRKLKAITNQTPNEYIITVRFGKAAELLLAGEMNVSEIAYKFGFSEPTNFARAFTKVYGKSPKKYVADMLSRDR